MLAIGELNDSNQEEALSQVEPATIPLGSQ